MKKEIIKFIVLGLIIALFIEIWRIYLINKSETNILLMILLYIMYLLFAFYSIKKIKNKFVYYLFFGIIGLIIEVVFLGQFTQTFVNLLVALSVFTFWGAIALIPRLIIEKSLDKFTIYFILILSIGLFLIYLITNNALLFIILVLLWNIPILRSIFTKRGKAVA
jgi:hypothetical protein